MITVRLYYLSPVLGLPDPDAKHQPPPLLDQGEIKELCIALQSIIPDILKVKADEVWVRADDAGPWPPPQLAYWVRVRMPSSDFDRLQSSTFSKAHQLAQAVAKELGRIRRIKGAIPPGEVNLEIVEGSGCAIPQNVIDFSPVAGLAP